MNSGSRDNSVIRRLLAKGKRLYHESPSWLRWPFWPVRKTLRLVDVLKLDVWAIMGDEISSEQKLGIIYAGCHGVNKNFVADLAFGNSFKEHYVGKRWLWKIPQVAKENHDCSLMIAEVPNYFHALSKSLKYFYIPSWVDWEIDASSYRKKDSVKTDARAIRKNNLHFELTNSVSDLHNFYYKMYIPHLTRVYGNRALVASYGHVEKEFRDHGQYKDLLLIKKGKEYIAGALLGHQKNKTRLWDLGVKDGDLKYVKDGAIRALFYFFALSYSAERGFRRVNFGASRPFLKDGILEFKKKRGLSIVNAYETGFLVKPLSRTRGVQGFLVNNPLIYQAKTGLNGAIFVGCDASLTSEDLTRLCRRHFLKGMSKLVIYRFGEADTKNCNVVPPEFCDKVKICAAAARFPPDRQA